MGNGSSDSDVWGCQRSGSSGQGENQQKHSPTTCGETLCAARVWYVAPLLHITQETAVKAGLLRWVMCLNLWLHSLISPKHTHIHASTKICSSLRRVPAVTRQSEVSVGIRTLMCHMGSSSTLYICLFVIWKFDLLFWTIYIRIRVIVLWLTRTIRGQDVGA